MALTPGTRLGPYEIVSALGAGGMGEVWRARDTKLGREVAIKTLPEAFAADPDRRARFLFLSDAKLEVIPGDVPPADRTDSQRGQGQQTTEIRAR